MVCDQWVLRNMWFVIVGAIAGSLLLLLAIQWLLLEDHRPPDKGFSPDDLLTNIRLETVFDLLGLLIPRRTRFVGEKSRLAAWLARSNRRNRRLQYRIIMRMTRQQRKRYLQLEKHEIEKIARRAYVTPQDVVELVIRPCAQIDRLLRRTEAR